MNLPRCACGPHPEPPSHLPPHTIPLGHPSAPAPTSCIKPALVIHLLYDIIHVLCRECQFSSGIPTTCTLLKNFILFWSIADIQYSEFQVNSKGTQSYLSVHPGPKDTPPIQAVI